MDSVGKHRRICPRIPRTLAHRRLLHYRDIEVFKVVRFSGFA